ncbi:hypothetical protein PIB30_006526 [Stylosanthes scabra]|uniref:Uncharacterized protein n=1 Tax=Stylosanthes scabra TaxID=79078 RepID=A0ABU6W2E3_9FABA|nr:hypothetical protein [Stylosanthes scabra]
MATLYREWRLSRDISTLLRRDLSVKIMSRFFRDSAKERKKASSLTPKFPETLVPQPQISRNPRLCSGARARLPWARRGGTPSSTAPTLFRSTPSTTPTLPLFLPLRRCINDVPFLLGRTLTQSSRSQSAPTLTHPSFGVPAVSVSVGVPHSSLQLLLVGVPLLSVSLKFVLKYSSLNCLLLFLY